MKKTEKVKENRKFVVIAPMIVACVVLAILWIVSIVKSGESISYENGEKSTVTINWDDVNKAIENYDFAAKGYYLETEYKESQKELNCVMVSNYDSSKSGGFKEVNYQLLITYGECTEMNAVGMEAKVYDEPMIEISLLDNNGSGEYAVIYNRTGKEVETFGKWFLAEEKEEYLQMVFHDACEMFGLQEEK
ncbi:MAG: hypothetical protein ACI4ES_00735 [Roseburia sp.]